VGAARAGAEMKRRKDSKSRTVREKILAVAARLFANEGYDAASMREIAEAAHVTKPTIYYYFRSKEGLFDALLEHGVSFLCGSLEEINARPVSADAKECLVDMVFAGFEFAREHSDINRFIHSLVFSPAKRAERQAIEKEFARVVGEFAKVHKRGVDAGILDPSRIEEAMVAIRGSSMAYIMQFLQGKAELTRRLAAEIVDGCLNGYGTSAGAPAGGAGN